MRRIGIIQNIISLQWLEEYLGSGEIKLVTSLTAENLTLLVEGNYIFNTDCDTLAQICSREIKDDAKSSAITIRGILTIEMFENCVVMATEQITDAAAGMLDLARKNLRGIPIIIPDQPEVSFPIDTQITWNSILDGMRKLGEGSGLGAKVIFDRHTGFQQLCVYQGKDRTDGADYIGYFGDDIGTITNIKISSDSSDYKNIAIVAGQGVGEARKVIQVGSAPTGNRRELYVDADDLGYTYQEATSTGALDERGNPIFSYETKTLTEPEYIAVLTARGIEKLTENNKTIKVSCDLEDTILVYGKDYALGDVLPLKISRYGLRMSARVLGVTIIYEKSGRTVKAKLSDFNITQEANL